MYEIREPIHSTIAFDDEEAKVVDHPIFQRMRHIRQIGLSYLVYPGATHDRFSHMLGAMHLAGRVWDSIMKNSSSVLRSQHTDDELAYFRRLLRYAALLHDVGHAPFSHVSEELLPKFEDLEIPKGWYKNPVPTRQAKHEDYSVMLIAAIGRDPAVAVDTTMARDIASLIHAEVSPSDRWLRMSEGKRANTHAFLKSLISGELDVDRMDYLLRDAYFTGVAYGVYDKDHLIRNLGVTEDEGRYYLTIDATAVRAFEDFLLARYHMFLQVYHHKTTNSFDHFLKQAFSEKEVSVEVPGTVDGYIALRDSTFMEALFDAVQDPKNHWSRRFVYRRPAKRLFVASGDDPSSGDLMKKLRAALEKEAVEYFTINSHPYISKMEADPKVGGEEKPTMLVREKRLGKLSFTPIERYSGLLRRYNEALDIENLYVLPEYLDAAEEAIDAHGLRA